MSLSTFTEETADMIIDTSNAGFYTVHRPVENWHWANEKEVKSGYRGTDIGIVSGLKVAENW